ncbi:RING-TYPE E3 UBIQUITIN TRANSFERASE [Salix purpurea]|uniref:RING-type E3 ubiquitin transferase n=1 Tax=Salix purpurea TaxID=77065 RepID=A0A9Q0VW17_SALPP|nr:RING-TYPE E3 UBIQUITIN TRANSFERASE [Salix purpurea]
MGEEERGGGEVVEILIKKVNEIASISDYRYTVKKQYCNLARRLKLLIPMLEEIRDIKDSIIPQQTLKALVMLKQALDSAKDLLMFGSEGSKIYLVLEREQIMNKYHEVTAKLEQALSGISCESLDISDEVKEQVELVLAQFRRAKGRVDANDVELYEDLLSLYNKTHDSASDLAVLRRLCEKLQLMGISDLTLESLALHEMVAATGDPGESIEKMSMLLKKIKDFVQTENPNLEAPAREKNLPPSGSGQAIVDHPTMFYEAS